MQLLLPTLLILVTLLAAPVRAGQPTDLELMLAVDASSSVDDGEFELQMRGLSEAFSDPAVQKAIRDAGESGVAVALMQWSDGVRQEMPVDWALLRDPASANEFARRIAATGRAIPGGGTAIYGAINFAVHEFDRNGFDGRRRVIDISGDGRSDLIVPTLAARDQAVALGISVNGLAILNDYPTLDLYYRASVIGGTGAFVMTAADFDAFAAAIIAKLIREISQTPVSHAPSSSDGQRQASEFAGLGNRVAVEPPSL